ncbi:hypothetical protein [Psychroserpens jangbogonensis]|uniref:hypothetical protein n=1 Tax=Psychroserpens jangbogonensis TaxID=1484460 RepID=UPI00053E1BBE|nr:hypothetical protein [Psychroserpens jangbogonensis]
MVRIVNYEERQVDDGKTFFVLELQGGIEMALSQETNLFYATARRTFISSTFDEDTCKALLGTSMHGKIERQECEAYEYEIKETGDVRILNHRFVYAPEPISSSKEDKAVQKLFAEEHTFSQNGVLEEELID